MTRRSPTGLRVVFLLLGTGLVPCLEVMGLSPTGSWVEEGRFDVLTHPSQQLPFLPAGDTVRSFQSPIVNSLTDVSFVATIRGERNYEAILTTAGGGRLRPVVVSGDAAPGYPAGFEHSRFEFYHHLTDAGVNVYQSLLANEAEQIEHAIYAESKEEGSRLLVGTGYSLPGAPRGQEVHSFEIWGVSRTGHIALNVGLAAPGKLGSPEINGIWRGNTSGPLELVALEGQTLPGLPAGVVLGLNPQGNSWISVDDDGRVAFLAQMNNGTDRAIGVAKPGMPARILMHQGQRIGRAGELTVGFINNPVISSAGGDSQLVLVRGNVRGVAGNPEPTPALLAADGTPRALLIEGGGATGLPAGTRIGYFGGFQIQPDDSTLIALRIEGAGIDPLNDEGIWSMTPSGELTKFIAEGIELSNLPGLYVGRADGNQGSFDVPIRVDGGIIFQCQLRTGAITPLDRQTGVVFVSDDGIASLIFREDDPIYLNDRLQRLNVQGIRDFAPTGLGVSPDGFLAFASLEAMMVMRIPEPPSVAILLLGLVGIFIRGSWSHPFRIR